MIPQADWSPLTDHIQLASTSDRLRFIAGASLGLASGVGAAALWLDADLLTRTLGAMLLLLTPLAIIGALAPRRWSYHRREMFAAAISVPAALGAWGQAVLYLAGESNPAWIWPVSFLIFVVLLGAFLTMVGTALTRILAED